MVRHYLVLAVGVLAISFAAIFIRLAQAPALVIAAYRMGLASLLVDPAAWIHSRQELRSLHKRELLLALLSGGFLALHFALWIASLSYTTVAASVVLVTANPIFVAIASHFLFREGLRKQTILGIGVCLAGAVLIGYGDWRLGPEPLLGDGLAFLGALAIAGYYLIGRRLRRSTGLLSYASLVYSSAGAILLLSVLVLGYPLLGYSAISYAMFVALALVPQLLGHLSLNWSLRFVPATLVTTAVVGEPVGASLWAYIVLGEVPTFTEIGGGILILGGIIWAFHRAEAH